MKQYSEHSQRFQFNSSEVNRVVSVVRNFILVVVNLNGVESVVGYLFFNSSEVKQHSERSQIFNINSSEFKQCSEYSQRFHFNSSKVKQRSFVVRDFILIVIK